MTLAVSSDVLIVGGGVIGASIAFHLTAGGMKRVVLCEQGRVSAEGATAQSGGLIRMHHTNVWQSRLAWESLPVFEYWAEIVGGTCGFRRTGFACVVSPQYVDRLTDNIGRLRSLGVPVLALSPEEFLELQPGCSGAGIGAVAYEPFSGYANPVLATRSFLDRAEEKGLTILEGSRVIELLSTGGKISGARTSLGEIYADTVVIAANGGALPLLEPFEVAPPIRPKCISICFLCLPPALRTSPLCAFVDDTVEAYFRPEDGWKMLVGAGVNDYDPLNGSTNITEEGAHKARSRAATRFPSLGDAAFVGGRIGIDGYTPDEHAIIGPAPGIDGLYLALGFSGGGFKIAPAVGRAVAAEILSHEVASELEPFRLERFEANQLIRSRSAYAYM